MATPSYLCYAKDDLAEAIPEITLKICLISNVSQVISEWGKLGQPAHPDSLTRPIAIHHYIPQCLMVMWMLRKIPVRPVHLSTVI